MTAKGNSNLTKKGTKQRSFNLDDATFAIVEAEATRLHVTNSAALSMILNGWADRAKERATQLDHSHLVPAPASERAVDKAPGNAPQPPAADLSYLLPSETASEFRVNDPGNDDRATGKPTVDRRRSRLDDKLNDDTDILGDQQ